MRQRKRLGMRDYCKYTCTVVMISVAVIGAGAAGLCVARHLMKHSRICVFEQASVVGGTWVYTDQTGRDDAGCPIHSSMYANLRTNLPKEIMPFPGFPFPSDLPSFVHHTDMLTYLENYAQHYDLYKWIRFNTKVTLVKRRGIFGLNAKWDVSYRSLTDVDDVSSSSTETFDKVVVCNGHFFEPQMPEIKGLDTFNDTVIHSHNYRKPAPFMSQTVMIIGAGPSGTDIAIDVSHHAKTVFLSGGEGKIESKLPENVSVCGVIEQIENSGRIILESGPAIEKVDAVIVCTGYHYKFDFLDTDCGVHINDSRITPLYKHIFHTKYPSLVFVGICQQICPFPHFDIQVRAILAAFTGQFQLPCEAEMNSSAEKDYRNQLLAGIPHRHTHHLGGTRQWDYYRDMILLAKIKPLDPVVQRIYEETSARRKRDLVNYKKATYCIKNKEEYEILEPC